MSVEARAAAGVASAAGAELAIFTALGVERSTLPRSAPAHVAIVQCGPGGERAETAARAALAGGAAALLSWGFAGALEAGAAPGTVVLPTGVIATGAELPCDRAWHDALAAFLADDFCVVNGALLGADRVLGTPDEKAAAAHRSGAVAVDMESAAIAAAAARVGARFAAIRVIVDALDDALPAESERWIDERGNRRPAALLGAVLAPREWRTLWTLGERYRTARAVLTRLAGRLGPRRFLVPGARQA